MVRRMSTVPWQKLPAIGLILAALYGCRGGGPAGGSGSLVPMEPAVFAKRPGVTVLQPGRVTRPVPISVALIDAQGECQALRRSAPAFWVCVEPPPPSATAEPASPEASPGGPPAGAAKTTPAQLGVADLVRGTMKEIMALRRDYVKKEPVTLVGGRAQTENVLVLASQEPSFFAGLVLRSGDPVRVSNARLYAYGQRGGKKIALLGVPEADATRVRSAAFGAGLHVAAFPETPRGLLAAVEFAAVHTPLSPGTAATAPDSPTP